MLYCYIRLMSVYAESVRRNEEEKGGEIRRKKDSILSSFRLRRN